MVEEIEDLKKEPFVSIVICTYNRKESLEKNVFKSISRLNYSNYEVIIVDDASTDDTKNLVEKYKNKIKNLKYLKIRRRRNLCYVRNCGVRNSNGKIIAFTDDDCYVDKNWLKELVKPYFKNKKIVVVGGKIYIRNSQKQYNPKKEIFGCNMSFRKEIFKKFLFDNNIYFNKCDYHEETDLINRIKNRNFKAIYTDKAIVNHFVIPGKHRKRKKIGEILNRIYIGAKKDTLKKYYKKLIICGIYYIKNEVKIPKGTYLFFKLYNLLIKNKKKKKLKDKLLFTFVFYLLFIEIPIKATIRKILEKRKLKSSFNK